ncbi:MAG TPA: hypothetical protein VN618_00920 [Solirubrobacteraceae bacterium]|nr:hypothetical protein [Solirubrobacteraceae bacterium]
MPLKLFVFLQFEFPWALGPADGRYLLRDGPGATPERVVVVDSLGARRAGEDVAGPAGWFVRRAARREREAAPEPDPAPIATTRVTVIDPVPLSAETQAKAWLSELDRERDVAAAVAIVNRVVHAHRLAAADPYVREVSAPQALVIRAGWGEGEQVASGLWLHARELAERPRRGRRRDRSWALRPQERLAALLSGRSAGLLCEELTLRARLDLDQGRGGHAAVALDRALAAAVAELAAERREDLALRIAELEQLREGVAEQAAATLAAPREPALDEELVAHALARLEATLRARTATGV